jgi:hypothetical protein
VKKSTKGHNSVKFGRSKNSFLYCHLHIKVVYPWKFKQNLPSGLRGVAFTRFRDVRTDVRTDGRKYGRTDKCNTICPPLCGGIKIFYHWPLMSKKSINSRWKSTRPEIDPMVWDYVSMLYAKYQEAVIYSCCEKCYENFLPLTVIVENLTKSMNRKWMSDRPEIQSQIWKHVSMLYAKYQEAVISSCWENCYENLLPLIINVENLTKSINRRWMSNRPEIRSHSMGHVSKVYAKYQEAVISSCWENC